MPINANPPINRRHTRAMRHHEFEAYASLLNNARSRKNYSYSFKYTWTQLPCRSVCSRKRIDTQMNTEQADPRANRRSCVCTCTRTPLLQVLVYTMSILGYTYTWPDAYSIRSVCHPL